MKRAPVSDLVLEGREIKLRLQAEREQTGSHVHVDWLRFTVNLRHAPIPTVETLFPSANDALYERAGFFDMRSEFELEEGKRRLTYNRVKLVNELRELDDPDYAASTQAFQLAEDVASILGPDFEASSEFCKGKDFYRFRFNITRQGKPVGWVGFLSVGNGARVQQQAKTIHCNLEGMACTFARPGWLDHMANYIDQHRGLITRCDLALDFFDGIKGGIERFEAEYKAGLMDHMGHRPKNGQNGDWWGGNEGRSVYFGSRAAGKITNLYEKGKQLFGPTDATDWLRAELRYGNQKRLLPTDMLRRPADFFAGASDWHAALVHEHGAQCLPEPVKTEPRLPLETVKAECTRNARWVFETAGKSLSLAFQLLDFETLTQFIENCREMPNRLSKFKAEEVRRVYGEVFKQVSASGTGRVGLQAA